MPGINIPELKQELDSLLDAKQDDMVINLDDQYGYDYDITSETITLSSGLSGTSDTVTLSPFKHNLHNNTVIGGASITVPWTTTTPNVSISSGWNNSRTGAKLNLDGEDADIVINGESVKTLLQEIKQRLNILHPNTEMEKEWDQLRELGEQYRKLEAELKEKSNMWQKLKSMPPPEID